MKKIPLFMNNNINEELGKNKSEDKIFEIIKIIK